MQKRQKSSLFTQTDMFRMHGTRAEIPGGIVWLTHLCAHHTHTQRAMVESKTLKKWQEGIGGLEYHYIFSNHSTDSKIKHP